jgi:hypothetical protein
LIVSRKVDASTHRHAATVVVGGRKYAGSLPVAGECLRHGLAGEPPCI